MNERIRELMIKADYPAPELALRAQALVELIVQDLIHSMIKRYGDDDELPIQEIKLFVKEHFGVEE